MSKTVTQQRVGVLVPPLGHSAGVLRVTPGSTEASAVWLLLEPLKKCWSHLRNSFWVSSCGYTFQLGNWVYTIAISYWILKKAPDNQYARMPAAGGVAAERPPALSGHHVLPTCCTRLDLMMLLSKSKQELSEQSLSSLHFSLCLKT